MCRLYGSRASEPTKVECSLVHAQNALMKQSERDRAGMTHGHGWGIAAYEDGAPVVERQAWAAYHDEHFRRIAARIRARTVLAHVRHATVGPATLPNTHPFVEGRWALAHNGTLPRFEALKPEILAEIAPRHRAAIAGVTDSEHIFRLLLTRIEADPDRPLRTIMAETARELVTRCRHLDAAARIGLNLILTDGRRMVGTRFGRTLHYLRREGIHDCEVCGLAHVPREPARPYFKAIVASEPITHERWSEVPEGSVWEITRDFRIEIAPF